MASSPAPLAPVPMTWPRMRSELLRALPFALLLAVALAGVLVIGVNLSNAYPSEGHPFGWPGTSPLWNGVATVRSDLVLATTLPALLFGVAALHGRDPRVERTGRVALVVGVHAALILLAVLVATGVGALAASKVHGRAFAAFFTAHALLALSFYALAFLCAAVAGRWALPAAGAVWLVFHAAYENATRWAVFREAGYFRLAAGDFPTWFYAVQAGSPLSAYRGTLILWERGFMDYLERVTIGQATLPTWVSPGTFLGLGLAIWVALPLGVAAAAWAWRGRERAAAVSRAEPA